MSGLTSDPFLGIQETKSDDDDGRSKIIEEMKLEGIW